MVRDHRIQNEDFEVGSLIGANFDAYTGKSSLNGILVAVKVRDNNYAAGSLFLVESGTNLPIWSNITTANASGIFNIIAIPRDQNNAIISGTAIGMGESEIPLFGNYRLIGSGLGASKSGLGISLVYKMG